MKLRRIDLIESYLAEIGLTPRDRFYSKEKNYHILAISRGRHIVELFIRLTRATSLHGLNVLDVGCGTGGVAISSAAMGAYAVALDLDIRRLRIARIWAKASSVEMDLVRATALHLLFLPNLNTSS